MLLKELDTIEKLYEYERRRNLVNGEALYGYAASLETGARLSIEQIINIFHFIWKDYLFFESLGPTLDFITMQFILHLKETENPLELLFWSFRLCAWGGYGNPLPYTLYRCIVDGRFKCFYSSYPEWHDTFLDVDSYDDTLQDYMKHIPDKAGEVTIYLVSDTEEPQSGISIPIGEKITSVRIVSSDEKTPRSVWPADRSIWFFCNGIPLVIDRSVSFEKMSMIMGGFVTYSGHNVEAPQSTIVVNGKTYWVYAGGQSDREGHSSTVQDALVIINGEVDRVYAGGRAIWGETFVHNSTVIVKGTAREVYCSGYTEYSAARATVGRANMKIYGWYYKYGLGIGDGEIFLLDPNGCF